MCVCGGGGGGGLEGREKIKYKVTNNSVCVEGGLKGERKSNIK